MVLFSSGKHQWQRYEIKAVDYQYDKVVEFVQPRDENNDSEFWELKMGEKWGEHMLLEKQFEAVQSRSRVSHFILEYHNQSELNSYDGV